MYPKNARRGVFLFIMERYSVIKDKNPREIVLLRGRGCVYKKCPFCDYHTDASKNDTENFAINQETLAKVTGRYGNLEVINSGSVFELDENTLTRIKEVCREKKIGTLHFESHYLYKDKIPALRERFSGIDLKMKLGLETFDFAFREERLKKGIPDAEPEMISENFQEANFLFGLTGQTEESMRKDIELGLRYFERICLNIMCENSTHVKPDGGVIKIFVQKIYPEIRENPQIDILIENTDFGVGE